MKGHGGCSGAMSEELGPSCPIVGDVVDIYQREFLALRDRLHAAEQESLKRSKELNLVLDEIKRAVSERQALRDGEGNRTWGRLTEDPRLKPWNVSHRHVLHLPTVFHHLPHLLAKESSLQPAVRVGQGRTGVSVVMGIPSVRREVHSYLTDTLHSLISELSPQEKEDSVIVVLIAEASGPGPGDRNMEGKTPICNPEKDAKHCDRQKANLRIRFKPSLFQHVGTHSSLAGKIQKLKDKDFGKHALRKEHVNPPAEVSTSLKTYQHFTLEKAYLREDFFWAFTPAAGDFIRFRFFQPLRLERFFFRSGNIEHPEDKLFNTSVEVLPFDNPQSEKEALQEGRSATLRYPRSPDGYLQIGSFYKGVAEGEVDPAFGPLEALRLSIQTDSPVWVILSETVSLWLWRNWRLSLELALVDQASLKLTEILLPLSPKSICLLKGNECKLLGFSLPTTANEA
ncbi:alpha-1,3-mannosyl-glycoprotein 4-beta-N-acetylglucosaminyltransferase B [Cricetulus griseus]|uniref:Alpha-1,3-mannosyl-glycoprotein 4-beta-N-acetylglucosaminyltransferase B n=1 Tax=Cricetulus griseus TaxID=10029 RepID=A0A061HX10_CRIGR|nr:alpha-1,3-mannosyl-glycoprotein 4-beta-N-acetylglucosaminyltransferase B [Cricetulus griseus]